MASVSTPMELAKRQIKHSETKSEEDTSRYSSPILLSISNKQGNI